MKYFFIILIIFININIVNSQEKKTANQILEKIYEKLKNTNSMNYDLTRELNYPSNNYNASSKWNCIYFFDPVENSIGVKFQIDNSNSTDIFNGTEFFVLNKVDKTIEIQKKPSKEDFNSRSYFYNSLLTLRNILPSIISDKNSKKTVTDTLINNSTYQKIKINLGKRTIQNLGEGFDKMETDYNFYYTIIIDSNNFVPKEILQTNGLNSDFIKTSFENFNDKPNIPKESSWFYSTYENEYQELGGESELQILSLDSEAPNWELDLLNNKKTLSLKDLKGKVVLLDFWIKNCGHCIENISTLNKLQEKFKNQDFVLIGINAYDSKEKIKEFYTKYGIKYLVLTNGELVSKKYGVKAFPTIFIIDKNGKIIYVENENSDNNEIERIIENALK